MAIGKNSVVPGNEFVAGAGKFPDDVDLTITNGEGCYIETESGDEYLDYLLGGGPVIQGHNHPKVTEAIQEQASKMTASFASHQKAISFAERISEIVPNAEAVKLHSTGSQGTYFGLRLARSYTGREKVLKFAGAYHGWHDYALLASSYADSDELHDLVANERYPDVTIDSAGMVEGTTESVISAPYNDIDQTREIVEAHRDELAAIIVEPIMRAIKPQHNFLSNLRDLCDEHGIVLFFDECVTGFRMALGGAQEYYGVVPDLAMFGKAIGGGVPLSAVTGKEEIMRLSDPDMSKSDSGAYLSGTLSGNPLCAAAGHATLDILEQPGTHRELREYAQDYRAIIDDVLADSNLEGQALGEGPIVDFALTDAEEVRDWQTAMEADGKMKKKIDRELLREGLIQLHGGKRYISIQHGQQELEKTAEAFKTAVERVS